MEKKKNNHQWYSIQTYGNERTVRAAILNLIEEMKLQDVITDVIVPTEDVIEVKEGKKKITICHFTTNGKGNTISISESAWQAHQKHGDILGECPKAEEKSKDKSKK